MLQQFVERRGCVCCCVVALCAQRPVGCLWLPPCRVTAPWCSTCSFTHFRNALTLSVFIFHVLPIPVPKIDTRFALVRARPAPRILVPSYVRLCEEGKDEPSKWKTCSIRGWRFPPSRRSAPTHVLSQTVTRREIGADVNSKQSEIYHE